MQIVLYGFLFSAIVALWVYIWDRGIKGDEAQGESIAHKNINKVIDRIIKKRDEPGMVERPSQREINLYNNPKEAEEQKVMDEIFGELLPKK